MLAKIKLNTSITFDRQFTTDLALISLTMLFYTY